MNTKSIQMNTSYSKKNKSIQYSNEYSNEY